MCVPLQRILTFSQPGPKVPLQKDNPVQYILYMHYVQHVVMVLLCSVQIRRANGEKKCHTKQGTTEHFVVKKDSIYST